MKYDFDIVIDRHNTNCTKWDYLPSYFKGDGILPMSVADMDFRAPQEILDGIKKVVDHGIFGYSRVPDSYYEALIDWQKRRHNWDIERDWVVMGTGVVGEVGMLLKSFTEPGDQVIVQTPIYFPFFRVIKGNKCEILENPLKLVDGQYEMDLHDLESKITERTKIMLLCNPHNPVGRVWKSEELRQLGKVCHKHGLLVISDEIHEDLVYEGFKHTPFPIAAPDFGDRWAVCTAASKTFNLASLKCANTIFSNEELRKRYTSVMYGQTPNVLGPAAAEAGYRYGEAWLEELLDYIEGNISLLNDYAAAKIPGLKVTELQGTYLAWLDFRECGISQEKLGTFAREDAKVGTHAGFMFRAKEEGFERMNIACPRSTLEEALGRIEDAVKRATGR